jgi:hypothetical protein
MAAVDPLVAALATAAAGVLMLLAGLEKKQLDWRRRGPHRRPRVRRPRH